MDVARLRAETPAVDDAIYLNSGSCSLMPAPVIEAVQAHLELESRIGGFRAVSEAAEKSEAVYKSLAKLINAKPSEIALMGSHTLAWASVFNGMKFEKGDRILTSRSEYAANYVSFLQMRKKAGCEVEVIPSDNTGATSAPALEQMMDERVKLIAINWIPTNGGLVNPAAEIGRVANAHGVPYLLDACQAVGQMPVDVEQVGCDYMSAAGRKWLRGPKGTGFLYVREKRFGEIEPATIDDIGAPWVEVDRYEPRGDARVFETHEHAPCLRLGLGAAVDYALDLGIEAIRDRLRQLASGLRSELEALPGVSVQDLGSERGSLVTFVHESIPADTFTQALKADGIWVKTIPRAGALMDNHARQLDDLVRVSAHCFNTEAELDTLLEKLREIIKKG